MIMGYDDLQTKLYRSVCNDNEDEVIKQCNQLAEKSLHYCTIHNSTVLHLACLCERYKLANKLFDNLPQRLYCLLPDRINASWDTVLHEASTSNEGLELARKLLKAMPELLLARNKWGETAVFRATRYGRSKIFNFLAHEVDKYCDSHGEVSPLKFFQKDDGTTILHIAILTENYGMAHDIALRYPDLRSEPTKDKWTALQILASSPEAFKSGAGMGLIEKFLYSRVSIYRPGKSFLRLPLLIEEVRMMKQSHTEALNLANVLIPSDTSWKDTHEPQAEVTPVIVNSAESQHVLISDHDEDSPRKPSRKAPLDNRETPLLLAARKGCIEIVKEILESFPQAVNYLNHNGENILHVAIKSRNSKIFYLVKNHISSPTGLIGKVDKNYNSILHMVGFPREAGIEIGNPVMQLSEDLQLLEELATNCPKYLVNHRNNDLMTPLELYAKNHKKLHENAKEWLKRTAENNIVLIILIATVAFGAAYTVPGGQDQTGYPALLSLPFFLVFTVTDVLSLGFALTAVVVFLDLMTLPYQLDEFRRSLPQKLLLGFTLVFLSVTMMMVAFAATVILMENDRARWTKIALYAVAFFPICIFMVSYITLYKNLAKTLRYWIMKMGKALPRFVNREQYKSNSGSTQSNHVQNSPDVQV